MIQCPLYSPCFRVPPVGRGILRRPWGAVEDCPGRLLPASRSAGAGGAPVRLAQAWRSRRGSRGSFDRALERSTLRLQQRLRFLAVLAGADRARANGFVVSEFECEATAHRKAPRAPEALATEFARLRSRLDKSCQLSDFFGTEESESAISRLVKRGVATRSAQALQQVRRGESSASAPAARPDQSASVLYTGFRPSSRAQVSCALLPA